MITATHRLAATMLTMWLCSVAPARAAPTLEWVRLLDSGARDESFAAAADGLGNVYLAGLTRGSLPDTVGSGGGFVAKYDSEGELQWVRQPADYEAAHDVCVDGSGNVYIIAYSTAGARTSYLMKYDATGTPLWVEEFEGYSKSIAVDIDGNVYTTTEVGPIGAHQTFVSKRDSGSTLLWSHQFGASDDRVESIATDSLGNAYISGIRWDDLGGVNLRKSDVFVAKFNQLGTPQWIRQFGSSERDFGAELAADRFGNLFVAGQTHGSLWTQDQEGGGYLGAFNQDGALQWGRQFGGQAILWLQAVATDDQGSAYASGHTSSSATNKQYDVVLVKLDAAGGHHWTEQFSFGPQYVSEVGTAIAADGLGNIFVSGHVYEDTYDPATRKVFVAKFVDPQAVPEPASVWLIALAGLAFSMARTNRHRERARDFINSKSMRNPGRALVVVLGAILIGSVSPAEAQPTLEWIRQLGASEDDSANSVSANGLGSVYISGVTRGSLYGPNSGGQDLFLAKYDADGTPRWSRQFGNVRSVDASVDGLDSVYVSGYLRGVEDDGFLWKYDADGTLQWARQFIDSSNPQRFENVSANRLGDIYVSWSEGSGGPPSWDCFLAKYDVDGTLQWTRKFGTSQLDWSHEIVADGFGNIYIVGETNGSFEGASNGGNDAFLVKYDANGTLQWTRQLGTTEYERGFGVSADGIGNVYIGGETHGSLGGPNAGGGDAFLAKYDGNGALQWTQQLGTNEDDAVLTTGVSADHAGNVYISGFTLGNLAGNNAGFYDTFVAKYDSSGTLHWTQQFGTHALDAPSELVADGLGNVYIAGLTEGDLGGPNAGGRDAFLAKFVDPQAIPEPASVWLAALATLTLVRLRRSASWQVGDSSRVRAVVIKRIGLLTVIVLTTMNPAEALVTSDQFGSHIVTPGAADYGIDFSGVVMVGAASPSGDPLLWGTGCLITDRHVLTAAHLFDDDEDGQIDPLLEFFPQSVMFELPDGRVAVEHDVAAVQWPDSWPSAQGDLAVLTLTEDAPAGVPRYPLYGGRDEVGRRFVLAGYGRPGHGATGQAAVEENQPVKRAGLNRFEAVRDDYPGVEFLAYDFDSGLEANNSLALIGVESDLGFGIDEVFPAEGDSGGPAFLGGAVAGITNWVASHPEADVTGDTDSSWGEGGFSIRVTHFRDFINAATEGTAVFVPEPSSLLLAVAMAGVAYLLSLPRDSSLD